MAFTQEEEELLRFLLEEFKARTKLNAAREVEEEEFRAAWTPLRAQIEANHKTTLDALRAAYSSASDSLNNAVK